METKYLTEQKIQQAAQILKRGGLLGIPTETVYGLGANGLNEVAVANIFKAKGRPQDNPLILHIPDVGWLDRYCMDIPTSAYTLARSSDHDLKTQGHCSGYRHCKSGYCRYALSGPCPLP